MLTDMAQERSSPIIVKVTCLTKIIPVQELGPQRPFFKSKEKRRKKKKEEEVERTDKKGAITHPVYTSDRKKDAIARDTDCSIF